MSSTHASTTKRMLPDDVQDCPRANKRRAVAQRQSSGDVFDDDDEQGTTTRVYSSEDLGVPSASPFVSPVAPSPTCPCERPDCGQSLLTPPLRLNLPASTISSSSATSSISTSLKPKENDFVERPYRPVLLLPAANYMEQQSDLTAHMRTILVDWLIEVAIDFKLRLSTLFLAVSIVDRFLTLQILSRTQLQLLGITALLVAARKEGVDSPDGFVDVCDGACTLPQVEGMEFRITATLNSVDCCTTHSFLSSMQGKLKLDDEALHLSTYLAELTLLHYPFIRFHPSIVAASAVALALHSLGIPPQSQALEECVGCSLGDQLGECMAELLEVFAEAPVADQQTVREKYLNPNPHLCVAQITPPSAVPAL